MEHYDKWEILPIDLEIKFCISWIFFKYACANLWQSIWCLLQLCSLSTISREYVAVHNISSLPFKDIILAAGEKNPTPSDQAWKISKPLGDYIKSNLNESQQEAINVSISFLLFYLSKDVWMELCPFQLHKVERGWQAYTGQCLIKLFLLTKSP